MPGGAAAASQVNKRRHSSSTVYTTQHTASKPCVFVQLYTHQQQAVIIDCQLNLANTITVTECGSAQNILLNVDCAGSFAGSQCCGAGAVSLEESALRRRRHDVRIACLLMASSRMHFVCSAQCASCFCETANAETIGYWLMAALVVPPRHAPSSTTLMS